jgi:general secretion pathway protein F
MTNMVMREAIKRAIERVREGASLARAPGETRAFPPLLVHLPQADFASGQSLPSSGSGPF